MVQINRMAESPRSEMYPMAGGNRCGAELFKWVSYDRRTPPLSHSAGLLSLGALFAGAYAHWFSTLQLGVITAAILILVAIWEALALGRP